MGTEDIGGETRVKERPGHDGYFTRVWGVVPTSVEAVERLVRSTMDAPWTRSQIESALDGPTARTALAWDAGSDETATPIGFVFARRLADILEIDLVGVAPARRRAGIARALLVQLIEAESDAESADRVVEVQLELAASNAPALALYQGLGFVVVGRRSRYYPDGDDALLLTKAFE